MQAIGLTAYVRVWFSRTLDIIGCVDGVQFWSSVGGGANQDLSGLDEV
jgi:hypothetical protein